MGPRGGPRHPVSYTAQFEHKSRLTPLLAKGADPNFEDRSGQTPLYLAAESGRVPVLETSSRCAVPIQAAVTKGHEKVVHLLLSELEVNHPAHAHNDAAL